MLSGDEEYFYEEEGPETIVNPFDYYLLNNSVLGLEVDVVTLVNAHICLQSHELLFVLG